MNPSIKKLPKNVQSIICASNQINSYVKAVEELVFNSLDADATSIAVRINIADGSIQVVDNGCGISKSDFKYVGQKYMTSKLVDISTLKSAPNKYGFQGQSLANLAQISETLNVISRFDNCETTWVKTFENGKAKLPAKWNPRPSKGTTIEIKGFLHNLNIQKKSVNSINELQNIKIFLEHISLVHSNVSLSLRNDLKNEIVYQIHKNRDIYQTLSTLYEIDKSNVQELQVEKNQYKVKAFVGKNDTNSDRQIIFLNNKRIPDSSTLHKKVNENFKKCFKGGKKKLKKKFNDNEENHIFANKIPFYFIFISCPLIDYELNNTVLEFKDWGQINTLLDKLIKFYAGDIKPKGNVKNQIKDKIKKQESESTKNRIDEIMKRILGTHDKKLESFRMQNGVKGKLIKRKPKNSKSEESCKVKQKRKNNGKKISKLMSYYTNHEQTSINESIPEIQAELANNISISDISKLADTSSDIYCGIPKTLKRKTAPKVATTKAKSQEQNKIEKTKRNKKTLYSKFAMETESVKRRCELLSHRTKALSKMYKINPTVFIDESSKHMLENFTQNNKDISVRTKVNEVVIHEYIPLPPKLNVDKPVDKTDKRYEFKSTYDLLQTITNSKFVSYKPGKSTTAPNNPNQPISDSYRRCMPLVRELQNVTPFQADQFELIADLFERESLRFDYESAFEAVTPNLNFTPIATIHNSPFGARTPEQNATSQVTLDDLLNNSEARTPDQSVSPQVTVYDSKRHTEQNVTTRVALDDLLNPFEARTPDRNFRPVVTLHDSINQAQVSPEKSLVEDITDSPFQALTFQSHNYDENDIQQFRTKRYDTCTYNKKQRNFITMHSKENFMLDKLAQTTIARNGRLNYKYSKPFRSNLNRKKYNKSIKIFNEENIMRSKNQESYAIEFTESNDYEKKNGNRYDMFNPLNIINNGIERITPSMSYIFNDYRYDSNSPMMEPNTWLISGTLDYEPIQNNNTVRISSSRVENNIQISFDRKNWNNHETYTVERHSQLCSKNKAPNIERYDNNENNNVNYIFVSKSQENRAESQIINPIDVCETILQNEESTMSKARESNISVNSKQENNPVDNHDEIFYAVDKVDDLQKVPNNSTHFQPTQNQGDIEVTSHHFTISNNNNDELKQSPLRISKNNTNKPTELDEHQKCMDTWNENMDMQNTGAFNIRNRLIFVPKGMSPIFKTCHSKTIPTNDLEDYYEDRIYNDFMDKVQCDVEIFKPRIEAGDASTKDKMNKTNASLKFDGVSIRNAKVLGQIDSKFIAAIIQGKCNKSEEGDDFLVLFDQHAVHERIRLENNLADYLTGSQWKSVIIDEVTLKMTRDDILYLHNYREKFTQFGLEWSILNYSEITLTAIPEGILGKNPRQVEKIIKAVKNLIREEICNIQMQRGCVSLFPKSIMDLVFSEACRYAIKFGDHLPKSQCIDLLKQLSECKTPFQCAHGRPAMAVIMNIEGKKLDYKINFRKLQQFQTK